MFVMSLSLYSPLWRYTNIINKIPCMIMSCKVLLMFDRPIIDKTVNYIDQLNNTLVMYQVLTSTDLEGLTLINRLKLSALTWSSYGMFFDGGVSPKRKKKKNIQQQQSVNDRHNRGSFFSSFLRNLCMKSSW